MNKSHMLLTVIIASSLLFSACTMSASTPPPVTPTTNLSEIARQATQTAIAKTPQAGDTQVPDATEQAGASPTKTDEAEKQATSTPKPSATPDTIVIDPKDYPVPDSYTLKKGEFVYCLARRFNILPADIIIYNGLESGEILYPGDIILIPPDARAFVGNRALQNHPTNYTVVSNDTFHSIACLFGDVDPRAIAAANNMDLKDALSPGTVLQIP
jgi:LysM repeat protein